MNQQEKDKVFQHAQNGGVVVIPTGTFGEMMFIAGVAHGIPWGTTGKMRGIPDRDLDAVEFDQVRFFNEGEA
jgi:hypothetical protein